ncbi:MAG TPA: hypothetical protein PLV83_03840 [Bacilli bacterium]|nr:hypothetical protein [Bacilli bacterium]
MNKIDSKYAVNYYEIVNFVYDKEDILTERIIEYYKNYFLNIIPKETYKINYLDMIVYKYIDNIYFNTYVRNNIDDNIDYYYDLDIYLINLYKEYENKLERKITNNRWL